MTAMDIYSALGNVGEEMLEESELPDRKPMPKGILYMTAAAACFAVLAAGLSFAFNDSGIAAPEQGELLTVNETYPASYTQYTGVQTTETTRSVTVPLPLPVQTPDSVTAAATAPLSTTVDPDTFVEETVTDVPATAAPTVSETAYDEEETAIVPKWEDMSDLERYPYLDYNGATYSMTVDTFDKSELTFLKNGEIYGFFDDYWDDADEMDSKHVSVPCAFYKINNVDENYMIAALTADGNYTAYKNYNYLPDTLGSYLEDIDFSNRTKLMTTIGSYTWDENGTSTFYEYELPDVQNSVEKFLAENSDAVPEKNTPPVLGRYTINCRNGSNTEVMICDGGYIAVSGVFFNIGEDQTESFMAYIEENSVKTEYDPRAGADRDEQMIPE